MLSRARLHPHHSPNAYIPSPEQLSSQHRLPPALKQHDSHDANDEYGNLQAGRKRRESEMDPTNDSGDGGNVKRRISRACDQCNQLRTKCDGKNPCAHCSEIGLLCEYARAHKKRGRAPKRVQEGQPEEHNLSSKAAAMDNQTSSAPARKCSNTSYMSTYSNREQTLPTNPTLTGATFGIGPHATYYDGYNANNALAMNDTAAMVSIAQQNFANTTSYPANGLDSMQQDFGFPLGDDYSVAFMGKAPMVESPDWMALTTPAYMQGSPFIAAQPRFVENLRYPVLRPLSLHIEPIMPQASACDLLEHYFASSTSTFLRPSNPYVLGHIFRKDSILHATDPRPCTPALLASMLWISAQVSDAAFLTSQVDARGKVCQKLLELTINMLNPLIHDSSGIVIGTAGYNTGTQTDAGLASLVVSTDHNGNNQARRGQIDNLATYIHLATVVSASERKAASLRWWNAAWSLARELRLGRELPEETLDDQSTSAAGNHAAGETENRKTSFSDNSRQPAARLAHVTEEEREERRRAWWLLYMQDRHLALCYNRPTSFLNKECEDLLQPLDDDVWQSGRFETVHSKNRKRGLNIECTSHSVFGYFLPLMVILGEILDLNHARNRPRFGPKARQPRNWDDRVDEITQQLEIYGQSLQAFERSHNQELEHNLSDTVTPCVASCGTEQDSAELSLQTKTVVSYGTHILNVLHILLTGRCDPIALLDDMMWLSSQSFVNATGNAVKAAEAVADIIEHDPDLSFMPFFFGIYLLQGSFLLLLFAEKLQGDVSADVVKACETIVRAHEASIATLSTQYQLNFRKVMRSALQQVRGRIREDATEQQQKWRREILKLYRWTGDGTGLAL
ncbi:hypothetical protein LTS08_000765 [Lithohypha guttulata]|uniref:uncharacterized protein n=1 Tax=Lithohypha guttulata TaxID=1690604 RepID=UPI002DDEAAF1|nr:hypothetical protein LTR51_006624 [Lithohypha guttulata]KAK5106644.1 hypothetical protein LTS08_000765 [Lithohypha guttulata]